MEVDAVCVAMCCSVLQCVAVSCSVLQRKYTLQHTLQHIHCYTLLFTLQHILQRTREPDRFDTPTQTPVSSWHHGVTCVAVCLTSR